MSVRDTPKDIRSNRRAWVSDVITGGNIAKSVTAMVILAVAIGGLFIKADSLQSKEDAKRQHRRIIELGDKADADLKSQVDSVSKVVEPLGRDIKVIKCLVQARNQKQKDRCTFIE